MSIDAKVILFCQKEIIESGLVLDEDLSLLHMIECNGQRAGILTQGIVILGTALGTAFYAMKKDDMENSMRIALLFSVPAVSTLLVSLYYNRKAENQKKLIAQLLTEFRSLSRVHSEVNDFIKRFNYMIEASTDKLLKSSEEAIQNLSKYTCKIQGSLTIEMQIVIQEMHEGLQDMSLDLTGFEQATAVPLNHNSISDCLLNISFVEGQVVLLRSHLLTSMVLVSSSRGDPAIFVKVLDAYIPQLVSSMNDGIGKIKLKLNDVRCPAKLPAIMSLSNLENVMGSRKYISAPRMRKHVIKINDGICCTLMKLRTLLSTLENVESESQMVLLQETVASVTQELLKCCRSSADLEKLIQLVSRNQTNKELDLSTVTEDRDELCTATSTAEQVASENDELGTDSDYQVFENYLSDSDDDNEIYAVRFYKKHINSTVDWLAELRQSEEFQKRQAKFHTVKAITSTPIETLLFSRVQSAQSRKPCSSVFIGHPSVVNSISEFMSMKKILKSTDVKSGAFTRLFKVVATAVVSSDMASGDMSSYKIPPPPPPPSGVLTSKEITEILRPSTSQKEDSGSSSYSTPEEDVQTKEVHPTTESPVVEKTSSLLSSLKGVLDKMGPREEEQFE